jgi:hypothetical protein
MPYSIFTDFDSPESLLNVEFANFRCRIENAGIRIGRQIWSVGRQNVGLCKKGFKRLCKQYHAYHYYCVNKQKLCPYSQPEVSRYIFNRYKKTI